LRLALLAWLAGTTGTIAAQPELPALVDPANQEHYPGKIVFVQLVTPDLAAAKAFYAGLFGWTISDIHFGATEYGAATLENRPVAGLLQKPIKPGEHRQSSWTAFISTTDVDGLTKTAVQHGGKVLLEPYDVASRGREAVIQDPQGAVFAVLASSSGDPPEYLSGAGEWIWSSLITTDPDADAAFYQDLFGYDVFEAPGDKTAQHFILASDNYARASVNSVPGNGVHTYPHWLNYVRVADATAAAAKAVSLGGRILVEPRLDRHGGKLAVVADPLGAPFGLLEWHERDSKEVAK
jgi:hypothetical protein